MWLCRECGRQILTNDIEAAVGYHELCFKQRVFRGGLATIEEINDMWRGVCTRAEGEARERAQEEARKRRWEQEEARKQEEETRRQTYESWRNNFNDFFGRRWNFTEDDLKRKATTTSREVTVQVEVTKQMMRKMLMLCHPDKHENSKVSTEVTQFLVQYNEKFR